jgi:hypothetical protein
MKTELKVGQYWKGVRTGNVMRIDSIIDGEIRYTILNSGKLKTFPIETMLDYIFKHGLAYPATELDKALA